MKPHARRLHHVAALAAAAVLAVAGCGGGDEPAAPSGGGSSGGDTVEVSMENTTYVPMEVEVPVGGTIVWTNNDPFPHTVTKESGPGAQFDSGDVAGGETFEHTFDAAGEIPYVCEIHPNQTGTISVTE